MDEKQSPPLHLGVVAIEKGAFGSPSTTVANFTYMVSSNYFYLIIVICLRIVIWFEITKKSLVKNYSFK